MDSSTTLIHAQTLAWANKQLAGDKKKEGLKDDQISSPSLLPIHDDTINLPIDLRDLYHDGPLALKRWCGQALKLHETQIHHLRLRPIASMMKGETKDDGQKQNKNLINRVDGVSVISVPRSFGLSTTTGARGDAVSYVLHMNQEGSNHQATSSITINSPPSALTPFTIRGVVKVIKSHTTFQQELAALTLIHTILPTPRHAHYPHALAAAWSCIPTIIPILSGSSTSSAFSRPYSVSSSSSTTAGSTTTTDSCIGGLLLMDCASGMPVSEYFKQIGHAELDSSQRSSLLYELTAALQHAARALAELHLNSRVPSLPYPETAHPFIEETARQMTDMLQKLALDQYCATREKWAIDPVLMTTRMQEMKEAVRKDPGVCCVIHSDAHAGNMLWDASQKRLTLIDLPTMLQATKVVSRDATKLEPGMFRLDQLHPSPTSASSSTSSEATTTTTFSSSSPSRHTAACAHPTSLLLHGTALVGRDVCHFERKLDSFGTQAGMTPEEVDAMTDVFHRTYLEQGGQLTQAETRFFQYRSLLGEITQLVRHDSSAIKPRFIQQLQALLKPT